MTIENFLFLGFLITLGLLSLDITLVSAFVGICFLCATVGLMLRYLLINRKWPAFSMLVLVLMALVSFFVWTQTDYTAIVNERVSASILVPPVSIGPFVACIWIGQEQAKRLQRNWMSWAGLGTGSVMLTYSILIVWTIGNSG